MTPRVHGTCCITLGQYCPRVGSACFHALLGASCITLAKCFARVGSSCLHALFGTSCITLGKCFPRVAPRAHSTSLDKGVELDAQAKLPQPKRAARIDHLGGAQGRQREAPPRSIPAASDNIRQRIASPRVAKNLQKSAMRRGLQLREWVNKISQCNKFLLCPRFVPALSPLWPRRSAACKPACPLSFAVLSPCPRHFLDLAA